MGEEIGSCPRCRHPTGAGARYCSRCGMRLSAEKRDPGHRAPSLTALDGGQRSRGSTAKRRLSHVERRTPDLSGVLGEGAPRVRERRALAARLLALAWGTERLDRTRRPVDAAASFLRRFEGRPMTQQAYAYDLADWLVWLHGAGIDPFEATFATVESYAREPLDDGGPPAPATVARRLSCLSHFYRRAMFAGLIDRNPVDQVQRPRVPEQSATLGISKTRAQLLIGAARQAGPREALLVLLMLELGLRVSEVIGANIEDISEQGRHRVLAIRGKGQASKSTLVPLNRPVGEAIAAAAAGRSSGPLLTTATGRPLTRQHAGKIVRRLGEQIGVPRLHPHALRHAFVTLSLDEGIALRDVQDAARHADPRTTRRYDRNRHSLDRHPTHQLAVALEP